MIKRIFKYFVVAVSLPVTLLFVACEETDYLKYDTSINGIYFTKDTLSYSFGVAPLNVKTYEYEIPVRVMGGVSAQPRPIEYAVIDDSTQAEADVHYRIKEAVVPANSVDGHIVVEIIRDNLEGTYPNYTRYKLGLQLLESDFFTPTLNMASQIRVLRFDNAVEQPNWLNSSGQKVWLKTFLGEWHPYKLIKMVEYFHELEQILPETYKNIVKEYGENLEHIPDGSPVVYATVFRKYIYSKMYNHFNEEREMILSKYPDFIFDFPNPYGSN